MFNLKLNIRFFINICLRFLKISIPLVVYLIVTFTNCVISELHVCIIRYNLNYNFVYN